MPALPPMPAVPPGVPAALWAWLWLLVQLYIKLLLLIWITTITMCRGTVFATFIGRAGIVIASALVASTTPKMLAAWVTLANLMQCPDMRRLRADWNILTRARKYSQIAASTLFWVRQLRSNAAGTGPGADRRHRGGRFKGTRALPAGSCERAHRHTLTATSSSSTRTLESVCYW